MKKRWILIAILLGLSSVLFCEEYRFVLNTGHEGPSSYLYYHQETQYYISVSENGELLMLEPDNKRVIKNLSMTNHKILELTFNREYTELAFISYSDLKFTLEVWDWHKGIRLFQKEFTDKPLYIRYTMAGENLCLGQSDIPSVLWLDHETGIPQPSMNRSTALFQDAYIGASERTFMGYDLSGKIRYLRTEGGNAVGEVETVANLSSIEVIQKGDKVLTLGVNDENFYLINRQTGELIDEIRLEDLDTYFLDLDSGELHIIQNIRDNVFLNTYELTSEGFIANIERQLITRNRHFNTVHNLGGMYLLGSEEGDFYYYYHSTQDFLPFFDETHIEIRDLTVNHDRLYLLTQRHVISIESNFFTDNGNWNDLQRVRQINQEMDAPGEYNISDLKDDILFYPNENSYSENYYSINQESVELEKMDLRGFAREIRSHEELLLLLTDQSEVMLNNMEGETIFQWQTPSIVDLEFLSSNEILIGKSSSPGNNGMLIRINTETEEIVPLGDSFFHVLDIEKEVDGPGILILGLTSDTNGDIFTELVRYEDNRTSRLFTMDIEDSQSRIFQNEEGDIFITMEQGGFLRYDGRRTQQFNTDEAIEKMSFFHGKAVFLYQDGRLGMWDQRRMDERFVMNFFSDLSWLAISNDESEYFYTPQARNNFFVYRVIRR